MDRRTGDKIEIGGDYQYNAYYVGRAPQRFWHYAKIQEAIHSLQLKSGDNVLDVGCGSGLVSSFMADHEGVTVTAIDSNQSALDFARRKFQKHNLTYTMGLLDELALPPQSFDKIIFLEVIEHISEKQGAEVLKTFYKLLKPGGIVVVSTPNKNSLWPLLEWALDFFKVVPSLAEGQHEFLYTGKQLEEKGTQAGFTRIDKRTINTLAPWLALINWKLAVMVHRIEYRFFRRYGSILLYTFYK